MFAIIQNPIITSEEDMKELAYCYSELTKEINEANVAINKYLGSMENLEEIEHYKTKEETNENN